MASMLPREYKLVQLNTGLSLTVAKDLEKATATLQEYVNQGWHLQQLVSQGEGGALVAVLYKER
ncbi:MAG: hypothetical protein IJZ68_08570 [Bacteroidaceae bacterium]|nr:hypothetical protein [Bacteroidaceae bacterium]